MASCRDVVVLIPGIGGSVLEKDGVALWGPTPRAIYGLLASDGFDRLALSANDDGSDDVHDGVIATSLIPDVHLIPGLWRIDGYSDFAGALQRRAGLLPGRNYFEFPYDWRRDNRVAARRLAASASAWLTRWRAESGDGGAKLAVVAHSMGGLVARHFIECLEGWRITRTLVSFGTPFRGSMSALGFLANGYNRRIGPAVVDATRPLRSFASIHQLLPTYPCVAIAEGCAPSRVSDVTIADVDPRRVAAALAFHDEIRIAQATNARMPDYSAFGTVVRPVVGFGQATDESATMDTDVALRMLRSHPFGDHGGDGTVPRVSAMPAEFEDDRAATYVAAAHATIHKDVAAVAHVAGVLGAVADLGRFRADAGLVVALDVADVHDAAGAVLVEASASDPVAGLEADVTNVQDGTVTSLPMDRHSVGFAAEIPLRPGTYRIAVSARGGASATDVFVVSEAWS